MRFHARLQLRAARPPGSDYKDDYRNQQCGKNGDNYPDISGRICCR